MKHNTNHHRKPRCSNMHLPVQVALSTMLMHALVLVVITTGSTCHGWGTTGHEIVANIAWSRLSNETRAWVAQVLNVTSCNHGNDILNGDNHSDEDPGSPLGAVADWADRVRHFLPWSAPLHYIDIRDDQFSGGCHEAPHLNPSCRFEYDRDCPNDECVAGAIVNYTHQLLGATELPVDHPMELHTKQKRHLRGSEWLTDLARFSNIPKTKEALMFLTHFIGDIHQPLHCSRITDKGGNDFHVHFNLNAAETKLDATTIHHPHHHGWNLHSVWDTGLIDVALARDYNHSRSLLEQALLEELNHRSTIAIDKSASITGRITRPDDYLECDKALGANRTCTIQWGQESWDMAIRFAYTLDDNSTDVTDGATLDENYYLTRWPLAKERLLAGAVRLAGTLEWIAKTNKNIQNENHVWNNDHSSGPFVWRVLIGSSAQRPFWWLTSLFAW